ncbi:alginate lyase-domain-containing protein [Dichotomocladium elegans]|nr:alginate lyase-domain-containing protein [Dichotomocladium elegans]
MPPLLRNDSDSRSSSSHSPPPPLSPKQRRQNSYTSLYFGDFQSRRKLSKDKYYTPRQFASHYLKRYFYRLRRFKWLLLLSLLASFVYYSLLLPSSTGEVSPHNERDQLLLYRIIGNDLPPRHKQGQTLSNLHFILEHEPVFPNTRKIFLLNRISDPVSESAIIDLLERYHAEYLRIPFVEEEYKQIDFRLEEFSEPDFLHSDDYRRFSKVAKLRTLDFTYHDKNLYAMNNNGGRNRAIQHGKSMPNTRWIMPFDGNCYLSQNAFNEIKAQLDRYGLDTKYFVVPMIRLLNNSVLLNNMDQRPKAHEEPQIIFRYDTTEEYNLNMRYGRRSKLELLWRLGALENRRLNRPTVAWEPMERPYSADKGNFRTIGWVFRLFSGNQQQEESKKEASSIRAFNRLLAIQSSLDGLDESIARRVFRHDRLFLYNETAMAKIRHAYWSNDSDSVRNTMSILKKRADEMLQVAMNDLALIDNDPTDGSTRQKPIIPQDLGVLAQNITTLALAHYYLGSEKYGRWAGNLVRVHFLSEYALQEEDVDEYSSARMIPDNTHLLDFLSDQGYSFPSLSLSRTAPKQSQPQQQHTTHRIILNASHLTKTDITTVLDAMRLLRRAQMLTHREYLELQASMGQVLEYLITIPTGIHLAQMTDHRGVLYDLQVTALAAFTDDVRLFLRVANRCRMRIGKQFLADGSQPYEAQSAQRVVQQQQLQDQEQELAEENGDMLMHHETLNLQYWTMLARGIQNSGIAKDIWHYTAKNQGRISHAVVAHLKKYAPTPSLMPLAHLARAAFAYSDSAPAVQDYQWMMDYPISTDRIDDDTMIYFLT